MLGRLHIVVSGGQWLAISGQQSVHWSEGSGRRARVPRPIASEIMRAGVGFASLAFRRSGFARSASLDHRKEEAAGWALQKPQTCAEGRRRSLFRHWAEAQVGASTCAGARSPSVRPHATHTYTYTLCVCVHCHSAVTREALPRSSRCVEPWPVARIAACSLTPDSWILGPGAPPRSPSRTA